MSLFQLLDPVACHVDIDIGAMAGGTGAKRSLIRDLTGVFADAAAFATLVAERGNEIAYAVEEPV